ncbi:MAG: VWA domain-containing protein [Chitinophagaceae bacterium]|nr:MAG: VWA domain-containing protein [Chitinophagaceae bacterium]
MTLHQVHNLIILDESGSMESIKQPTLHGFNEIVQTIKGVEVQFPEQEHFISLISFNGLGRKVHLWKAPVKDLKQLDARSYQPDASTPLFDAMGISMARLSAELAGMEQYNVLVTIFTDGEENASQEFSGDAVRKMITQLQQQRWTFTYIGTDHDVTKVAINLNITNVMAFEKNEAAMQQMFRKERSARTIYSRKIRDNESTQNNFYDPGQ